MTLSFSETNLIRLRFPFTQRVECKICFAFDPVDAVISRFADLDEQKDFLSRNQGCSFLIARGTKDIPPILQNSFPVHHEWNLDCWITKWMLSL